MQKLLFFLLILGLSGLLGCGPSKEQLQTLEELKKLASEAASTHETFMKAHQKEDEDHKRMEQRYDSLKAAGKSTPAMDSMAAAHRLCFRSTRPQ
jgi:uncharacterized protein (DUF1786 family)